MTDLKDRRAMNREAERLLTEAGVSLLCCETVDFRPTGQRFSIFNGSVTAVWCSSHFTKIPFGTFKVIERSPGESALRRMHEIDVEMGEEP